MFEVGEGTSEVPLDLLQGLQIPKNKKA